MLSAVVKLVVKSHSLSEVLSAVGPPPRLHATRDSIKDWRIARAAWVFVGLEGSTFRHYLPNYDLHFHSSAWRSLPRHDGVGRDYASGAPGRAFWYYRFGRAHGPSGWLCGSRGRVLLDAARLDRPARPRAIDRPPRAPRSKDRPAAARARPRPTGPPPHHRDRPLRSDPGLHGRPPRAGPTRRHWSRSTTGNCAFAPSANCRFELSSENRSVSHTNDRIVEGVVSRRRCRSIRREGFQEFEYSSSSAFRH
jgi:hypothetical protein